MFCLLIFAALATTVLSHGIITSPSPRTPGPAMGIACGTQLLSVASSDVYGPIQLWSQTAQPTSSCNLYLCKGMQAADSPAPQSYTPGQTIPITVDIRAPHTGYANVSIVNTKTNAMVSPELVSWDVYASTSAPIPANETQFSVTIPSGQEGCTEAGECVIQWYWNAPPPVNQTYEACVDFVLGGDGSSSPAPVSSSSAVAAPVPTTLATSSVAAPASTTATAASLSSVYVPPTTAVASTSSVVNVVVPTASASVAVPIPPIASGFAVVPAPPSTTGTTGSGSVAGLPAGVTLTDLLQWLKIALNEVEAGKPVQKRSHARDLVLGME